MDSGFDFFRISRISIGEYRNYVYVFYIYQKSLHIPCIYIYIYSIFRYMYTASRIPNSGRWNWNSLASWIVGLLYGRNYTGEGKMYTWSKTHTTCPTYLLLLRIWSNSRLSSGNEARLTAHDQWIIAIQKCFYPTLCIPMHIWISSLHLDVSPSLHLVIPSLSMPLHWHAKEFGIFFFFFFFGKRTLAIRSVSGHHRLFQRRLQWCAPPPTPTEDTFVHNYLGVWACVAIDPSNHPQLCTAIQISMCPSAFDCF